MTDDETGTAGIDKLPPFSPEQDKWISERIDAALAREKGYIDRVGKFAKSIVIWIGALLATGVIGFSAFNVIAVSLNWKNAGTLITQAKTEYDSRLETIARNLETRADNLQTELDKNRSIIEDLRNNANSFEDVFEIKKREIAENLKEFNSYLAEKERDVDSKLEFSSKKLELAQRHYDEIVKLVQSLNMYSVIEHLSNNKELVVKELTAQIRNDPGLLEEVADKINSTHLRYNINENRCRNDENFIQSIDFETKGNTINRVLCVSMSNVENPE